MCVNCRRACCRWQKLCILGLLWKAVEMASDVGHFQDPPSGGEGGVSHRHGLSCMENLLRWLMDDANPLHTPSLSMTATAFPEEFAGDSKKKIPPLFSLSPSTEPIVSPPHRNHLGIVPGIFTQMQILVRRPRLLYPSREMMTFLVMKPPWLVFQPSPCIPIVQPFDAGTPPARTSIQRVLVPFHPKSWIRKGQCPFLCGSLL